MTAAEWRYITLTKITRVVLAATDTRHSPGGSAEGNRTMTPQESKKSGGNRTMTQESKELTTYDTEVENIQIAAQEDAGFEKILKFKKGDFLIGDENVPLGTEYVAHVRAWGKCWIKFVDGEMADRKMYRVALGEKPPEREELDDQDENGWPVGLDGKPADPWVFQHLLPLEDPASGKVVIFVTSSFGGKRAVADLCGEYAKRAAKNPDCGQPIIKLRGSVMPTKKFGKVPCPLFEVIGWDEAPPSGGVEIISPTPPVTPKDSKDAFGDEIPF
jgi:hypothetical protein